MTDDVMAGAPPRGGSFDLSEIRHCHYGDADAVLMVDQTGAGLLHHEFSPPSPAPQDSLSYAPCSALVDWYILLARDVIYTSCAYATMSLFVCLSVCLLWKFIGAL